jgi:autotransporter-associated beta strand protein
VEFDDFSTGGNAQFTTDGGATVDFSHSSGLAGSHVITMGSIAGAGTYDLGANQLIVGNRLPTIVSGAIDDGGGLISSGASLVKVGKATLTLSGAHNTYSGGTTIEQGTLDLAAIGPLALAPSPSPDARRSRSRTRHSPATPSAT